VPKNGVTEVWGGNQLFLPDPKPLRHAEGFALSKAAFPELLFGALRVAEVSGGFLLSAHPCFHGLQRPQADDLRALNLPWVSRVFTDVLDDAVWVLA
jgi:hypothetical protein